MDLPIDEKGMCMREVSIDEIDSSPEEYFSQAAIWGKFASCLRLATEDGFREALALAPQLRKGGGLWMVEPHSCHALIDWARGAVKPIGGGLYTNAWSNETIRDYLTRAIWPILLLGGARKWLNTLSRYQPAHANLGAIHFACGFGSLTALELLLDCSETNVNLPSADGFTTPFMHCTTHSQLSAGCAQLLIQKRWYDIDVDAQNATGQTITVFLDRAPNIHLPEPFFAAWNSFLSYLTTIYYPRIHAILNSTTLNLSHSLANLILEFCKPHTLDMRL